MEFAVFYILATAVVSLIASSRGRSGFGWFLLAFLTSPLIAVVLLVCLPKKGVGDPEAISVKTHVKCPDCAELVRKEAKVCKHCSCKLEPQASM